MGAVIAGPGGAVPVRRYGRPGGPTLVWLHGGGFFHGGLDQPESDAVAGALADRGLSVVTVDYRLAPLPGLPWVGRTGTRPRARWPHAHDDVVAVVQDARRRTPGPLLLGGASAGACLASAATLGLLDAGDPPDGVVLAYGFHHARLPRDRTVQRTVRGHRRVTHAPWALDVANRNSVPRGSLLERTAFAGGQDLAGFPPTLAVDAASDAMRASGERFAAELVSAGTSVERHVLADRHAFLNRPGTPAFVAAIDLIGTWATSTARFRAARRGP